MSKYNEALSLRVEKIIDGEDEASAKIMDDLYAAADSTCTIGYDNDGSTGYDIFKNGEITTSPIAYFFCASSDP